MVEHICQRLNHFRRRDMHMKLYKYFMMFCAHTEVFIKQKEAEIN